MKLNMIKLSVILTSVVCNMINAASPKGGVFSDEEKLEIVAGRTKINPLGVIDQITEKTVMTLKEFAETQRQFEAEVAIAAERRDAAAAQKAKESAKFEAELAAIYAERYRREKE